MGADAELQKTIEGKLRDLDPEVELVALEQARGVLRLFIDRPGGVDLALCESVSVALRDLNETFALEVSSPGADRQLTKPEHYRRFVGRMVRVKTLQAIDGQRNFTGTLADSDDDTVVVAADDSEVRIPFAGIKRSNLVPGGAK